MDVELTYQGEVETVVIDGPNVDKEVSWGSVLADGRTVMPVQGTVGVHLAHVEDLERPNTLTRPAQEIDSEVWEIRTDDLFRLETVPVRADPTLWDRWASVEVSIRYADPANSVRQQSTLQLSSGVPGWDYVLFVMAGALADFDYRLRYVGKDGRQDYLRDWTCTDEREIRIRDPFPAKQTISVIAQADWTAVDRILVDLRYEDPPHGVRRGRPGGRRGGRRTHEPGRRRGESGGRSGETGRRVATPGNPAVGAPGAPSTALVTFKLKYVHQEERKHLTLVLDRSEAERETYAPQGFFSELAGTLSGPTHFLEVDLDDPFFRIFTVDMQCAADFAALGLISINVALSYGRAEDPGGPKVADLIFDAAHAGTQQFSAFMNAELDMEYAYRIEYNFAAGGSWHAEARPSREPVTGSGRSPAGNGYGCQPGTSSGTSTCSCAADPGISVTGTRPASSVRSGATPGSRTSGSSSATAAPTSRPRSTPPVPRSCAPPSRDRAERQPASASPEPCDVSSWTAS